VVGVVVEVDDVVIVCEFKNVVAGVVVETDMGVNVWVMLIVHNGGRESVFVVEVVMLVSALLV